MLAIASAGGREVIPRDQAVTFAGVDYATGVEAAVEFATLIRTGYDQAQLRQWFGRVDLAARIDNGVGLHNDEQGPPSGSPATAAPPGRPWTVIWPQLRRYR